MGTKMRNSKASDSLVFGIGEWQYNAVIMYEFYIRTYLEIGVKVELVYYHKRTSRGIVVPATTLFYGILCHGIYGLWRVSPRANLVLVTRRGTVC